MIFLIKSTLFGHEKCHFLIVSPINIGLFLGGFKKDIKKLIFFNFFMLILCCA